MGLLVQHQTPVGVFIVNIAEFDMGVGAPLRLRTFKTELSNLNLRKRIKFTR